MSGWKTYAFAAAIAGVTFAKAMGWITLELYEIILGLLGAGGLAALRAGVTKSGPT